MSKKGYILDFRSLTHMNAPPATAAPASTPSTRVKGLVPPFSGTEGGVAVNALAVLTAAVREARWNASSVAASTEGVALPGIVGVTCLDGA